MNPSKAMPVDLSQQQFALRLIERLQAGEAELPYDVTERLRAARHRAVQRRKAVFSPLRLRRPASASAISTAGSGELSNFWGRFAGWFPLVALVIGLFVIQSVQNDQRANELAEIDAALLIDDLPPAAYADPGFAHFLKTQATQNP